MNILMIAALCLTATILCKLLGDYNKSYALALSLAVCVIVMAFVLSYIQPIISTVESLFARASVNSAYVQILFKAIGICYVTQFAYDICKDSGENAIATQVELGGKVALLLLSLPLFEGLLGIVERLISF